MTIMPPGLRPPHNKHSVIPAQAGMTRKCGRFARRHIALDCHSHTPTFSTLTVLLRNDRGICSRVRAGPPRRAKRATPPQRGTLSRDGMQPAHSRREGLCHVVGFAGGNYITKSSPRYTFLTISSWTISAVVPCFKIFPSCRT